MAGPCHLKIVFFSIFVFSLLSACTSVPVDKPVDDPVAAWSQRQKQLDGIQYWYLSGRVAVKNGVEAWNLDMNWSQKGEDYQVELSGPFGAGKVRLTGNARGVSLTDSDNQTFQADSAEQLLYETTGVTMPVEGLRYWIVGLTGPQQKSKPELDNQGRLAYLEDARWKVKFRGYMGVNGLTLPRKIFIERADKEIDVRLVVDNWKLGVH